MKRRGTLIFLGICAGMLLSTAALAGVTLDLEHASVDITAFYDGTTTKVSGSVPEGTEVVLVVSGQPEELHLKKKGKAAGLFWMNVGDLTLDNAPRVYMVYTSTGAADAAENPELAFSFPALKERVLITPGGSDKDLLFGEFLKLKKKDKVYAAFPGAVALAAGNGDTRNFEATLIVPPRMGQGDYTVTAFGLQDHRIVGQVEKLLGVRQKGFPAQLSNLAFKHGLSYGILSVLVAIGAGLFMGTVFRGKGGGGAH